MADVGNHRAMRFVTTEHNFKASHSRCVHDSPPPGVRLQHFNRPGQIPSFRCTEGWLRALRPWHCPTVAVRSGKSHSSSVFQFPHMQNGREDTQLTGLLRR